MQGAGMAVALTFDACDGPGGWSYDGVLIEFLRQEQILATPFLNARWIDANPRVFNDLAADPLFDIANRGTRHLPLSVQGRSAYGIPGTADVGEVYDEVEANARELHGLRGAGVALPVRHRPLRRRGDPNHPGHVAGYVRGQRGAVPVGADDPGSVPGSRTGRLA
jgi:peptidoglycan/xylan/chitin deacetylase (PgdA/CDA1 family)